MVLNASVSKLSALGSGMTVRLLKMEEADEVYKLILPEGAGLINI